MNGSMAPVDHAANAKPINFQVASPATWNRRAVQMGGGGMNGTIPMLAGGPLAQGFVTYGSDSSHQMSFGRGLMRSITSKEANTAVDGRRWPGSSIRRIRISPRLPAAAAK